MSTRFRLLGIPLCWVVLACSSSAPRAPEEKTFRDWTGAAEDMSQARYRFVTGQRGMVVSDDRTASEWGVEILRRGGNAVDAAVATAFALAVTRPHYASLGGGGFLVYCPAPKDGKKQPCATIDYRETAPGRATRDMFIRNGKPDSKLSQVGALASGVPGVVSGLLLALEKYGTVPRQKILAKPIDLARTGMVMSGYGEAAAADRWEDTNEEARRIFGCRTDGKVLPCPAGTRIVQKDLARVLEEISRHGRDGFYGGWVAKKIVDSLNAAGGIFTLQDLKRYRAMVRPPVQGIYLGNEIVSMPPPSSGGTVLIELLGFAERAAREGALTEGFGSVSTMHALAHGMRLGFADRAEHFGDPDFVSIPTERLTSSEYLDARWKSFDPATAKIEVKSGSADENAKSSTTHFSVIDRFGNAVSLTTTINVYFGSGFVAGGTGVLMNNEMDDFSAQAGTANVFGLVAGEKNAVGPARRPLSSMSPTIVRDTEGNSRIVIGALGGPRIITSVFLALVNRYQFGMALSDSVIAPRFHHQWRPDRILLETNGFAREVRNELTRLGYPVAGMESSGKISALERFPNGRVWGVPDPRTEGVAVAE